jgi:hypothetical protein
MSEMNALKVVSSKSMNGTGKRSFAGRTNENSVCTVDKCDQSACVMFVCVKSERERNKKTEKKKTK